MKIGILTTVVSSLLFFYDMSPAQAGDLHGRVVQTKFVGPRTGFVLIKEVKYYRHGVTKSPVESYMCAREILEGKFERTDAVEVVAVMDVTKGVPLGRFYDGTNIPNPKPAKDKAYGSFRSPSSSRSGTEGITSTQESEINDIRGRPVKSCSHRSDSENRRAGSGTRRRSGSDSRGRRGSGSGSRSDGSASVPAKTYGVVIEKQYRPPLKAEVIEFPAGLEDDPVSTEKRSVAQVGIDELREETGFVAITKDVHVDRPAALAPRIGNEHISKVHLKVDLSVDANQSPVTEFKGAEDIDSLVIPYGKRMYSTLMKLLDHGKERDQKFFKHNLLVGQGIYMFSLGMAHYYELHSGR